MLELDPKLCGLCGGCVAVCPYGALELFVSSLLIKTELCTLCENCVIFCPVGALQITSLECQASGTVEKPKERRSCHSDGSTLLTVPERSRRERSPAPDGVGRSEESLNFNKL